MGLGKTVPSPLPSAATHYHRSPASFSHMMCKQQGTTRAEANPEAKSGLCWYEPSEPRKSQQSYFQRTKLLPLCWAYPRSNQWVNTTHKCAWFFFQWKTACLMKKLGDLAWDTARNSLLREELQGAAARGDLAHGVTASLAEPCCGWRLVVDVHRWVGPLCWWGTWGGTEQTAEAKDRKRPVWEKEPRDTTYHRHTTEVPTAALSSSWKLPYFCLIDIRCF